MIRLFKIISIPHSLHIDDISCFFSPPIETQPRTILNFSTVSTRYQYEIPTGFVANGSRLVAQVDCGFELKNNPRIEEFIEFAYQKGFEAKLYPSNASLKERVKESLRKSYFVHLGVNTLPDSTDQKKLEEVVSWILLLFAFDNVIDNSAGKLPHNKEQLQKYVETLQNTLKGRGPDIEVISRELTDALGEIEGELALKPIRMAQLMYTPERPFERSFLSETKKYLESSLTEMSAESEMTIDKYFRTRESSGAIDTVVRLAEGTVPGYLSEDFNFQQMNKNIVIYIWGVNDIGGAKEFNSHEPSFLKIQTDIQFKNLKESTTGLSDDQLLSLAFNNAFRDLILLVNKAHKEYLTFKQKVLNSIDNGSIFTDTTSEDEFRLLSGEARTRYISDTKEDFLYRCEIRENLAAAGNECTRVSTRYYDPNNLEKNIRIPEQLRGLYA